MNTFIDAILQSLIATANSLSQAILGALPDLVLLLAFPLTAAVYPFVYSHVLKKRLHGRRHDVINAGTELQGINAIEIGALLGQVRWTVLCVLFVCALVFITLAARPAAGTIIAFLASLFGIGQFDNMLARLGFWDFQKRFLNIDLAMNRLLELTDEQKRQKIKDDQKLMKSRRLSWLAGRPWGILQNLAKEFGVYREEDLYHKKVPSSRDRNKRVLAVNIVSKFLDQVAQNDEGTRVDFGELDQKIGYIEHRR